MRLSRNVPMLLSLLAASCGARTGVLFEEGGGGSGARDAGTDPCADGGGSCYEGPRGTRGLGACAPGELVCRDGASLCEGQVLPTVEECDGDDDDCDGEIDDDVPGAGAPCDTGFPGACAAGQRGCVDGSFDCVARVGVGRAPERCGNGVDDDCDGAVDEDPCATGCLAPEADCTIEIFRERCYAFCPTRHPWEDARTLCAEAGGHLLVIEDRDEDQWADATGDLHVPEVAGLPVYWWMGLDDLALEGVWVWETGDDVVYENWYVGEPNDMGRHEDCGTLNRFDPDVGWNDQTCDVLNPFICEDAG